MAAKEVSATQEHLADTARAMPTVDDAIASEIGAHPALVALCVGQ
jgi:hypothetical protein